MGIFVDYKTNIFSSINNIPTTIVEANTNVLWITSLIVCNKGAQPIRFNLKKIRRQGTELEKSCSLASTLNLTATYNNGTNGLGATLINSGTLIAFSIDGISPSVNTRILIKNQTSAFQNGIYELTTIGDGSTPWVLTRTSDFDTIIEIEKGDVINITDGVSNANTQWILNSIVNIIGTDPITFIANTISTISYVNELQIDPYATIDIIDNLGPLNIVYSVKPYINDRLVCFTNGYTQIFDCEVVYAQLNELPFL